MCLQMIIVDDFMTRYGNIVTGHIVQSYIATFGDRLQLEIIGASNNCFTKIDPNINRLEKINTNNLILTGHKIYLFLLRPKMVTVLLCNRR